MGHSLWARYLSASCHDHGEVILMTNPVDILKRNVEKGNALQEAIEIALCTRYENYCKQFGLDPNSPDAAFHFLFKIVDAVIHTPE